MLIRACVLEVCSFTPERGNIRALNTTSTYGWKRSRSLILGICLGYAIVQASQYRPGIVSPIPETERGDEMAKPSKCRRICMEPAFDSFAPNGISSGEKLLAVVAGDASQESQRTENTTKGRNANEDRSNLSSWHGFSTFWPHGAVQAL